MSQILMAFTTPIHARQISRGVSIPAGSNIAIIGTSLTDNGYRDTSESSSIRGYTARGAFSWVRVLTNQNLNIFNRGIGGNNIDQMGARYDTDIASLSPDFVFFDAGTNDSTKTFEDYKTSLTTLYAKASSHGAIAVPLTIPMRDLPTSQGVIDLYLQVNEWILANYPNAIEVNTYFADNNNRPKAGYTVDGIHYSNIGAYAVAKAILDNISVSGVNNIIGTALTPNPILTGTGGTYDSGITGTMPNDYHFDILSGTPTVAIAANNPSLSAVFTSSGSAGVNTFRIRGDAITANGSTIYEFISKIKLSNWDGWDYVQLRLNKTGGTETIYSYDLRQEADNYPWPSDALVIEKLLRTDIVNGESGATLTPYIEIGILGDAVGTGQMDVTLWQIQQVE